MAKLSLADLNSIRERMEKELKKRDIHGRSVHVVVGMGTSGIASGAKVVLNVIADEVDRAGLDNVIITQTGSLSPLKEPAVEVYEKASRRLTVYEDITASDAKRIVTDHLAKGKVVTAKAVKSEEV